MLYQSPPKEAASSDEEEELPAEQSHFQSQASIDRWFGHLQGELVNLEANLDHIDDLLGAGREDVMMEEEEDGGMGGMEDGMDGMEDGMDAMEDGTDGMEDGVVEEFEEEVQQEAMGEVVGPAIHFASLADASVRTLGDLPRVAQKSRKAGRRGLRQEALRYPGPLASTKHQHSIYWSILEGRDDNKEQVCNT